MGFTLPSSFYSISSRSRLIHNLNGSTSHFVISMSLHGLPLQRSPSINDSKLTYRYNSILRISPRISNFTVCASTTAENTPQPSSSSSSSSNSQVILVSSALAVVLSVTDRVLYKLALVPMKQYPFFLAQLTTFGYVVIYFSILYTRYRMGIVTDEMLSLPKFRFMAIGFFEALGLATGMASAAVLPGPAIPIFRQTHLVWQLAFSAILLRRKYYFNQIAGCLLVATGVIVAVASGSNTGQTLSRVEFIWPAIMIASCAFEAGASIIKEFVFVDAQKHLKGKSLDIFVVNSFGSGFQALFVLLALPFLSNLKGIPFAELPSYLKSGAGCFLNMGASAQGCDGAPLLPLLYIATNMAFNVAVLRLMKNSSAVVSSLVVMLSVPLSIYVLSLPLPYLPGGASLSPFFLFGSVILVLGLILYNIPQPANQSSKMA